MASLCCQATQVISANSSLVFLVPILTSSTLLTSAGTLISYQLFPPARHPGKPFFFPKYILSFKLRVVHACATDCPQHFELFIYLFV